MSGADFCENFLPLFIMKPIINKPVINKPAVGEGMVYFMVWTLITLVPILNSQMMSEEHIYMVNILTA